MGVFGDVLGVDYHAVVLHATEVKDFATRHVECSELGYHVVEVDTPLGDALVAGEHAVGFEGVELLDESRSGQ